MKKNNKGFSLVELIVVVLIMGILAVALTPQVLKWVNNSRIANDKAMMDTIVSSAQTALTNKEAYDAAPGVKIEIHDTASSNVVGTDKFSEKVAEYCGYGSANAMKTGLTTKAKGGKIVVEVDSNRKVKGTYTVNGSDYDLEKQ